MKPYILFRTILILVMFAAGATINPQSSTHYMNIEGFWEGEFMPGNNLVLILTFTDDNAEGINGSIQLYQDGIRVQDDPLGTISFSIDQLSFIIEAKDTPFKGTVDSENQKITGEFIFPDGSVHDVSVSKVTKPSFGDLENPTAERSIAVSMDQKYSIAQLQNDFAYLKSIIETTHPQPYQYTSQEQYDSLYQSLLLQINIPMTEDKFFRIIAPYVAEVHCSHTGTRMSSAFTRELNVTEHLIPFEMYFNNSQAYIITDYTANPKIEPGMRIVSINGVPVNEICERLMQCIPSDAYNETYKAFEINTNFSLNYSLYIETSEQYTIECLTDEGTPVITQLPGFTTEMFTTARTKMNPDIATVNPFPFQFEILSNQDIGLLKIPHFQASDFNQYKNFLQETFALLHTDNIQNLIIDLRGNRGGHPFFAAELLSYLAKDELVYFELPEEPGEMVPLYEPIQPKQESFHGEIYILVNGGCLSTTGHFLSLVRYHQLAILIGEEPGGTFYCNDGSMQVDLPATQIVLNLPQITFQTAVEDISRGDPLLPDYEVSPTLEDILNNRDSILEYAIQQIRHDNQKIQ